MSKPLNIFAIVVTYHPDIEIHLAQLRHLSKEFKNIIIVDNASPVEVRAHLLPFYKNLGAENIFLDNNYGLASAQNIGIRHAQDNDATHVVLFDQDSIIQEGFLDALLGAEKLLQQKGEWVAAIGPRFYDAADGKFYPVTRYLGPLLLRFFSTKKTIQKASFLIASGSMISISVIKEVGLKQEILFVDYIDVEWCFRARAKGYNCFVCSEAIMSHSVGEKRFTLFGLKISVHSPFRRYYLIRNSFYMLSLNYVPFGYKLRELLFNILRFIFGLILIKNKISYLRFAYYGVKDGRNRKFGSFFDHH